MDILKQADPLYRQLARTGAFLASGDGVMTIGWGAFGVFWGKPCVIVGVRKSRYTYQPLIQTGEFTISIPLCDMDQALRLAGTLSGRDGDKWKACGLTPISVPKGNTPGVKMEHGLILCCHTLLTTEMEQENTHSSILPRFYANGDLHTMFFGEVLAEQQ